MSFAQEIGYSIAILSAIATVVWGIWMFNRVSAIGKARTKLLDENYGAYRKLPDWNAMLYSCKSIQSMVDEAIAEAEKVRLA